MDIKITISGITFNIPNDGKPDHNGRIYSPGVLKKAIGEYLHKEAIKDRFKKITKLTKKNGNKNSII